MQYVSNFKKQKFILYFSKSYSRRIFDTVRVVPGVDGAARLLVRDVRWTVQLRGSRGRLENLPPLPRYY